MGHGGAIPPLELLHSAEVLPFLSKLESNLGRRLRALPVGRPRKPAGKKLERKDNNRRLSLSSGLDQVSVDSRSDR